MNKDIFDLTGKVALVTRASRVLVEAIARLLAAYLVQKFDCPPVVNLMPVLKPVAASHSCDGGEAVGNGLPRWRYGSDRDDLLAI